LAQDPLSTLSSACEYGLSEAATLVAATVAAGAAETTEALKAAEAPVASEADVAEATKVATVASERADSLRVEEAASSDCFLQPSSFAESQAAAPKQKSVELSQKLSFSKIRTGTVKNFSVCCLFLLFLFFRARCLLAQ
jgi:hypothetical protein